VTVWPTVEALFLTSDVTHTYSSLWPKPLARSSPAGLLFPLFPLFFAEAVDAALPVEGSWDADVLEHAASAVAVATAEMTTAAGYLRICTS
jgi:hypothetical protein